MFSSASLNCVSPFPLEPLDDDDENAGIFEMPVDVIMEQPSSIAVREYVLEKINELPFLKPMVLVIKRFLNVRRMKVRAVTFALMCLPPFST